MIADARQGIISPPLDNTSAASSHSGTPPSEPPSAQRSLNSPSRSVISASDAKDLCDNINKVYNIFYLNKGLLLLTDEKCTRFKLLKCL